MFGRNRFSMILQGVVHQLRLAAFVGVAVLMTNALPAQQSASVQDLQAEIARLRTQVAELEALKGKLDKLEKQLQDMQKAGQVTPANRESRITIDGRTFAGLFSSQSDGSYPNRGVDIPDSKIRFTFNPLPYITVVNRFSTNRAATGGFDYFYVDIKDWGGAWKGHLLRIGKHKLDIGQEIWTDNPVESILITNAVSHVSGYDEGINLRGPLTTGTRPWSYSLELVHGNQGFGSPPAELAWGAKIGGLVSDQVHVSLTYLRTGNLVKRNGTVDKTDINVAEVLDAPTGATGWRRSLWEVDLRYGYGKEGIKSLVGSVLDTPWQFALAYGGFTDDAQGAPDRKGRFGFAEALFRMTPRAYLALRYSEISLQDGVLAKLGASPIAVNRYRRLSVGLGYQLSRLAYLKTEYTFNDTSGGATDPKLDQFAVGVAAKF
ncbi:MAG: hypothetical protein C4335_09010 [Armatimonadota bacterium]